MLRKWIAVFIVISLPACSWIPGSNIEPGQPALTQSPSPILTSTHTPLPPTRIPTRAFSPTKTQTPSQIPTVTPVPTWTPTPTVEKYLYALQKGTPRYLPNFVYPEKGCNWISMAGQVFGKDSLPVSNMLVIARLSTNGASTEMIAMTGLSSAYGEGGYEIKLGDHPFAAKAALTAQVYDLKGNVLSAPVTVQLYPDCERNLILTNFFQK